MVSFSLCAHVCVIPVGKKTGLTACFRSHIKWVLSSCTAFTRLGFQLVLTRDYSVLLCWKMTIKHFSIEFDAINSKNIFTNGDTINGRIIIEVSKQTQIKSLIFIAQGRAQVCWSEHYGQYSHYVYWSDEKYYDVKHHILREARNDGNIELTK